MEKTINIRQLIHLSANTREWLRLSICWTCIFLFVSSAYEKLADHETFANGLSRVAVIGAYADAIAWVVPIAELIIGVLLVHPKTQKWGLLVFTGLMTVFTLYILSMIFWAEKLPCHCNLIIEKLSWAEHVWFNLGFIGLAVLGLLLGKSNNIKNYNYEF